MPAKIKRGDRVVVISGRSKGARGLVRSIDRKKQRVIIEGVNMIKVHQRARSMQQQSAIVEREGAVHISNVMLLDPTTDEPTRVTFRRRDDGSMVRVSKRTGDDVE